jgi:hypothetical protein
VRFHNTTLPVAVLTDAAEREANGGGDLAGGMLLLTRFGVGVEDPAVPYGVTMAVFALQGQLACESLSLTRVAAGPPVTSSGLRQAVIDTYLSRVREELGGSAGSLLVVRRGVDARNNREQLSVTDDEQTWAAFDSAQRRDRKAPDLGDVARLYREALASPDPSENRAPTMAVARRLHVHRGHAARLVSRARQEGLLGSARPGRFGEFGA